MANDYKIKFEYAGIGKASTATRQKVLQSQKSIKSSGSFSDIFSNEMMNSIKVLNSSIQSLVNSNKNLEESIKGGMGGGRTGPHLPGSGGGEDVGGGSGISKIGAGVGLGIGGLIAALGFATQKINQIGNAYIEKTSEQLGNVGLTGFQRSAGKIFGATEVGRGMKSYATSTGEFQKGRTPNKAAMDLSTIYGTSLEETMGQAGVFKRAGGNYAQTINQGMGAGIQSEMPMFMTGLSNILEEAIRDGVNASDMAKNIGKEISAIAMRTPGKSVGAAFEIINKFKSVKEPLERGKMGESLEGMYAAQASKDILTQKLTGSGKEKYIAELKKTGYIDEDQEKKLMQLKTGAGYEDIQKSIGTNAAHTLFKKTTAETAPEELQMAMIKKIQTQYGAGAKGFQQYSTINDYMGGSLKQSQLSTLWQTAQEKKGDLTTKGAAIRGIKTAEVVGSEAGTGAQRQIARENLMFKYGDKFAETTMKMEKVLLKMADGAAPLAVKGVVLMGKAAENAGAALDYLTNAIKKSSSGGKMNFWKLITEN
jgi:hypothetical protein